MAPDLGYAKCPRCGHVNHLAASAAIIEQYPSQPELSHLETDCNGCDDILYVWLAPAQLVDAVAAGWSSRIWHRPSQAVVDDWQRQHLSPPAANAG